MSNIIVYSVISAISFGIAVCSLLTDKMKTKYYVSIFATSFLLVVISYLVSIGQDVTIPVILIAFATIFLGQKTHPFANLCLAALGFMLNVAFNTFLLLGLDKFCGITTEQIYNQYYLIFTSCYVVIEAMFFFALRILLYHVFRITRLFGKIGTIKLGLVLEFLCFAAIFAANIILGQTVGYERSALIMNCILFGICFVISSIVLIYWIKKIQADESRKMDEAKLVMTQNYINGLECMIDESRSIRHDYKNILSTMSGYLQEDDYVGLKDYFNANIRNFVIAADKQGQIWNSLAEINPIELKGFLYEKALKASSLQVDFRVITEQGTVLQYHDMENLIRAFGNLMDNAIEAAAESAEKMLDLRIANTQNGISFIIRNSFAEKPDVSRMFQKGYTTKGDGHGEGLYYVKEYLDQHNDIECYFSIERNEFVQSLKIMNI